MDDIFIQLSKLTEINTGEDSAKKNPETHVFNESYSSSDEELFVYDDLVSPDIKPRKSTSDKPVVLVIDDDFATLDLMKIYLQREYEYVAFDDPKNAIFWLNTHVPDLIFMDCYLTLIPSKRVIDIIKSYKENADVPIFYLSEQVELGAVSGKLPEGVLGCIPRPVSRGDLQGVLNYIFFNPEKKIEEAEEEIDIFDAILQAENIIEANENGSSDSSQ